MSYASTSKSVLKLLTKKGRSITRRSFTAGVYDPATGSAAPATADETRKGVILDYGAGLTSVRGTLIQTGDKRLLLDAIGAAPQLQDHFLIGSDEYVIVSLGEVNPAGTPVIFDLHIRK